jgi:hypothetical protein
MPITNPIRSTLSPRLCAYSATQALAGWLQRLAWRLREYDVQRRMGLSMRRAWWLAGQRARMGH